MQWKKAILYVLFHYFIWLMVINKVNIFYLCPLFLLTLLIFFLYIAIHKQSVYECADCKYQTPRKADLKKHLKRHMGVRNYCCNYCSRTFFDKYNLERHINANHTKKQQYCCKTVCDNVLIFWSQKCSNFNWFLRPLIAVLIYDLFLRLIETSRESETLWWYSTQICLLCLLPHEFYQTWLNYSLIRPQ